MAVNVGTAIAYLNLDATNFNTGLANAQTALQNIQNGTGGWSQALGAAGTVMANTGTALTRNITVPLINAGKEVVEFGADFNKQMSSVEAVMKNVLKEGDMDRLREAAMYWGEQTVYTATEAAEALYYMGLAGWDVDQALGGLGAVLNLAAAGNLDLGRASDIVTDSMTAMNLQAGKTTNGIENTAYYTSVLAAVMANANTDVDKMGESFKYVAPIAGQLGYNIEDLGLALGLAANAGIKSSQAGTSLRQALKQLISPTDRTQEVMEKYGISLFDAQGKALPFREIMIQLQRTFGDLGVEVLDTNGELKEGEAVMQEYGNSLPISQQEKLQAVVDLFGTRAMPTMLAIIQQAGGEFDKLADAIDEAAQTGTYATEMAETQLDNLAGDWTRFTSALGTTKIMLAEIVDGWLRDFVQQLTELVKKFNELDSAQKEQIIKWGLVAAAVGPVMMIVGRLITTITTFAGLLKSLGGAFSTLISGFTGVAGAAGGAESGFAGILSKIGQLGAKANWVIALIMLVITAIVDLWKNSQSFRDKVMAIFTQIWNFLKQLWAAVKPVFDELGALWMELARSIEPIVELLVDLLGPALEGLTAIIIPIVKIIAEILVLITKIATYAVKVLAPVIRFLVEILGGGLRVINEILSAILQLAGYGLGKLAEAIQWIVDVFTLAEDTIVGMWTQNWTVINDTLHANTDNIVNVIQNTVDTIIALSEYSWNLFWTNAQEWWQTFSEGFSTFVDGIRLAIETVTEWFMQTIENVANWFVQQWEAFTSWLSNSWESLRSAIEETWNTFIAWVTEVWNKFSQWIKDSLSAIGEHIRTSINNFHKWLEEVINKIKQTAERMLQAIFDTAQRVWNSIVEAFNVAKQKIEEGIQIVKQKFDELREVIRQKFEEIKQHVEEGMQRIREKLEELGQTIRDKFEEIMQHIREKVQALRDKLQEVGEILRNKFTEILENIKRHFEKVLEKIKEFGQKFVDAWKNAFKNVQNGIASVFNHIRNGFLEFGRNVFGVARNVGQKFIEGLIGTGRSIKDFFSKFIQNAVEGLLSALKAFKEVGKLLMENLWNGMKSKWEDFKKLLKELWESFIQGELFSSLWDKIKSAFNSSNVKTKVNGSHADGLAYVPFNGYIAELHKGERVLTAEENQRYSSGGDGTTINFYSNERIDEYTAAKELRRTIKDMELGLV